MAEESVTKDDEPIDAYEELKFVGKHLHLNQDREDFMTYVHAFKIIRIIEKFSKVIKNTPEYTSLKNYIVNTYHASETFKLNGFRPPY